MNITVKMLSVGCWLLAVGSFAQIPLLDSLSLEHEDEFTNLDSALKTPEKVIKLVLRKNKLDTFPKEIFLFTNLQYLDLSKNKLKELPEEIGELKNLQKLMLSKNNFTSLPPEIGKLKNLRELIVSQNDIEFIPSQIGNLESLSYLDMYSNNIRKVPDDISRLKKLKVFDLRGIMMSDDEQAHIQGLVPKATLYFSASCKCKQ